MIDVKPPVRYQALGNPMSPFIGVRLDRVRGGRQKYKRFLDSDGGIHGAQMQPGRKKPCECPGAYEPRICVSEMDKTGGWGLSDMDKAGVGVLDMEIAGVGVVRYR